MSAPFTYGLRKPGNLRDQFDIPTCFPFPILVLWSSVTFRLGFAVVKGTGIAASFRCNIASCVGVSPTIILHRRSFAPPSFASCTHLFRLRTWTVRGCQPIRLRSHFPNFQFRFKSSFIQPIVTLVFGTRMGNTKTKEQKLPTLSPEEEFKQLVTTANITAQSWTELEKNLRAHIDKDIKREWAVSEHSHARVLRK